MPLCGHRLVSVPVRLSKLQMAAKSRSALGVWIAGATGLPIEGCGCDTPRGGTCTCAIAVSASIAKKVSVSVRCVS
eukprot:7390763-Prymnesium_polylepis.1